MSLPPFSEDLRCQLWSPRCRYCSLDRRSIIRSRTVEILLLYVARVCLKLATYVGLEHTDLNAPFCVIALIIIAHLHDFPAAPGRLIEKIAGFDFV